MTVASEAAWRSVTGGRAVALAIAVFAPLFLIGRGAGALADRLGDSAGSALADASGAWPATGSGVAAGATLEAGPVVMVEDVGRVGGAESMSSTASSSAPRPLPPKPAPPKGILVRAATVARAVQSGVRPSGSPVAATEKRPAGLSMRGVSGYGVGLADGDVLTSVGGTAATSVGAVIGAVGGALRSGAKAISATVWRGDVSFPVTVEIPHPAAAGDADAPDAGSDDAGGR